MDKLRRFLAAVVPVYSLLLTSAPPALAQPWTVTSVPSSTDLRVGSSPDGTTLLVATRSGPNYVSTNAGATWTPLTIPMPPDIHWEPGTGENWHGLVTSADGKTWVGAAISGPICISTNQGATWIGTSFIDSFQGVACSGDGRTIVGVADHWFSSSNSGIYVSRDGGISWTAANAPSTTWFSVACSADGTKLAAGADPVYLSSDSGATWRTSSSPPYGYNSLACSADGTRLIGGWSQVFVSSDSGTTWADTGVPAADLFTVTCSADGTKMAAAASRGPIYVSSDSGATWAATDAPITNWYAIASSADGMQTIAATYGDNYPNVGLVYTRQIMPAPRLTLAASASKLRLSWVVPSRNFVLQQHTDLGAADWTDVTTAPVLNCTNLQNQMTLPATPGTMFFRLVAR